MLKRNEPSSYEIIQGKLKCILLSERSQVEKVTYLGFQLYDILEKAKLWRQLKASVVLRSSSEGRKINRLSTGDFKSWKTILNDSIMVDTCHCTLIHTYSL